MYLGSSCGLCHVSISLVVPATTGWSCRGSGLCRGDGLSATPYQGILQLLGSVTVCCDRHGWGKVQDWGLKVGSHVLYKVSRSVRIIVLFQWGKICPFFEEEISEVFRNIGIIVSFCLVTILASKIKKKKRKKITSPINHPWF